jgi:hypothetical protein
MKNFLKKLSKKTFLGLFAFSIMIGVGFGWYSQVNAIPLIGGISRITRFCNDGFVIRVTAPKGGTFKVQFGFTDIYSYGMFMGSWVLGDSIPGGLCCLGKKCRFVPATVRLIGTSL